MGNGSDSVSECALIVGKTNSGKTKWILDLLQTQYKNKYENIVIICPTVTKNKTYLNRKWILTDPGVYLIDLDHWALGLNEALHIFTKIFESEPTLFILDDCSALQDVKYRKKNKDGTCELSKMAFSGRHFNHSCWLLTQKYNSVLKDYRENTAWVAMFYCKDKNSFEQCLDENDVVPGEKRQEIKNILRRKKYSKLVIRTEPPVSYEVLGANK